MSAVGAINSGNFEDVDKLGAKFKALEKQTFTSLIKDFYLTNPIARASAVMAECSALAQSRQTEAAE